MQRAFANEAEQRAFRDELEAMLRRGEADAALACVRERMQAWSPGLPVIDLALSTRPEHLVIKGWDEMARTISREEARGNTITAIGIDFSSPGHIGIQPDAAGRMDPYLETNYFADLSDMAFSTVDRAGILAGYDGSGTCWQGCFVEIDNAVTVEGMADLYGALTSSRYADRYLDDAAGDAHSLASCTSAILLHLAVRRMIKTAGLPKPLAVLVGSNEDFPFFDAPVAAIDEAIGLLPQGEPVRPAPAPTPVPAASTPRLATLEPEASISGRELRSRLEKVGGDEAVEPETAGPKSWLDRLLGR